MVAIDLTEKEITFLELVVEDLTYAEIAAKMFVGRRSLEDNINRLFKKAKVNSRVGLIRFSIYNNIGKIPVRAIKQL